MRKTSHLYILSLLIFTYSSCGHIFEPTSYKPYVPDLVLINKQLTFTMGYIDSPGFVLLHRDVLPAFLATLSPYSIGKYELRNDEFQYFVNDSGYSDSTLWSAAGWEYIQSKNRLRPVHWTDGDKPWAACELSNTADRPINNITWYEAQAYCNWLSRKTGESYTLPTEAQWERAARGPDPGRPFTYGHTHDASKYNNIMYSQKLYPAGYYTQDKSYDGCYDMAGNLLEFCADLYDPDIYPIYKSEEPVVNPAGPDSNATGNRSLRGSFNFFHYDPEIEYQIQTTTRMNFPPDEIHRFFGVRITKNIE